jgi:HAD superfamily phosphoserine phosphatase-like hydrolase
VPVSDQTPPPHNAAWAFLVDFDGTISDLDTFDVLVRHFAGDDAWHESERGLRDGSLSLRDVLQLQASHVRGSFADVEALLKRRVRIDTSFAPFVAACRARDVPVTVVSSGIEPIVRGRLAEIGLGDLPIVANGIVAEPSGWRIEFRDPDGNGTDKVAVVRSAQAAGRRAAFVGDGRSDYAAALAADRRYAKRGLNLEQYLEERNVPFTPISTFADIDLSALDHTEPTEILS